MILNIHGYSDPFHNYSEHPGKNSKYEWLVKNVKNHDIVSLDIFYDVEKPKQILERLLNRISIAQYNNEEVYIVASSLGGFFGYILNTIYPSYKTILLNPSLAPFLNLRSKYNVSTDICKSYVKMLSKYIYEDEDRSNLHIFFGEYDDVVDWEEVTIPLLPAGFQQYSIVRYVGHEMFIDGQFSIEDRIKSILDIE